MAQELAYVLVTPYSLYKARTGGILARLITRTGCDLVGMRLFAPGAELIAEYAQQIVTASDPQESRIQELLRDYVVRQLGPDTRTGRRRRVLMLLFKGEDAVRKVRSVVGNIRHLSGGSETIRDTYGDLILDESGNVRYFEPAVLCAPDAREAQIKLKIWARYSGTDGGVVENTLTYPPGVVPQRTLVLIKPDNFRFPTGRPGNVIDFFSRTGLYIVAAKVLFMSTAQALEFYGPVREVLRTRLKGLVASKAKANLEKELGFSIPTAAEAQLGEILGPLFGDNQFDNIVRFMSGRSETECAPGQLTQPGTEKCIALVDEGPDAVAKIRDVLGPTDPSKAPSGTIRREFGQNVMVNAAHASDSEDNARREFGIVRPAEDNIRPAFEQLHGALY